jgi:hypothetical protein
VLLDYCALCRPFMKTTNINDVKGVTGSVYVFVHKDAGTIA